MRANERRASLPATSSSSFLPIFENRTFFSRKKRKKGWRWRGGKDLEEEEEKGPKLILGATLK